MGLLVTELQKGRKELLEIFKTYGGGSAIKPAGFAKKFDKEMVEEILSTGHCKFLDDVDKTGERLMKSWHTRSTGHKNWDFTDLQSKSSPRIQQLYADLYRAYTNLQKEQVKKGSDTMITIQDAASDPNYDPAVLAAIRTKVNKAAEDLLKTIKSDKTMLEKVKEQYEAIKAGKTTDAEITNKYTALCKQLRSQHVAYVDDKSGKIVNNAYDLSEALYLGGAAGYLTGAIESEVLIWTLPLAVLASDVGFATVMAPLGVGVAVFALLGLTALALFVANETGVTKRLGKIMAKRYEKKVNEKLTAVLKCINESSRYVENYARKASGKPDEVNLEAVTDEMKKVVSGFIDDQRSLWSHYTSAEGKEYDEELTDEYGRHKSGLVWKQATAQKSEIGSYKLAVANIWAHMVCAC